MEAACAERRGAIGLVGMAGGEAAVGDRKVARAHAAEPTAAAELLIDADAVAGRVGDVGGAALDRVVRRLQLDEPTAAELAQREFAVEVRAALALEFGGDAEQALGPDLAPIVEPVMRLDLVSTPSIHGSPRSQRSCLEKADSGGICHSPDDATRGLSALNRRYGWTDYHQRRRVPMNRCSRGPAERRPATGILR